MCYMYYKGMTTVGTKGDSQGAIITQSNANLQESSNGISSYEWLNNILNHKAADTKKLQMERVPPLQRQNSSHKNCYDPLLVSLGPYHHGKPELEAFEKLKIPIAQKFLRAYVLPKGVQVQLNEVVENVGRTARECYEKGSTEDNQKFNEMIFLDACFILHTMFNLLGLNVSNGADEELKEVDVKLYKSQIHVLRDFFLLENQIPLVILKFLMSFMLNIEEQQKKLIWDFLEKLTIMPARGNSRTNAYRELDLDASPHLLHLMWEHLTRPKMQENRNRLENTSNSWALYHPVTKLQSVGIHFKPSQTRNVTDVEFKSQLTCGTLTLPRIKVDDSTKPLLLNLVAYEISLHGPSEFYIASYICLMNSLIDNANDVKQLREKDIVFNNLSSDEHLAQLFGDMANNMSYDSMYGCILGKIDDHCKKKRHVWIAEWMNKYFSNPWALLAFLGAILIFALTSVQSFFTVFPCKT